MSYQLVGGADVTRLIHRKRCLVLAVSAAAVVTIGIASSAYACQALATLHLSPASGPVGTTVTATGSNYAAGPNPVIICLDTRDGPELARTFALPGVGIRVEFKIPAGTSPGYHTILATQTNASGTPSSGTPGRAVLQVTGTTASATASSSSLPFGPLAPWPYGVAVVVALAGVSHLNRRRRSPQH